MIKVTVRTWATDGTNTAFQEDIEVPQGVRFSAAQGTDAFAGGDLKVFGEDGRQVAIFRDWIRAVVIDG